MTLIKLKGVGEIFATYSLVLGDNVIGKDFLSIENEDILPQHCIIEVTSSAAIFLKSGLNKPCFYEKDGSWNKLDESEEIELYNGEKFSLLPGNFMFEIVVIEGTESNTTIERNNSEKSRVHRVLPTWMCGTVSKKSPVTESSKKLTGKGVGKYSKVVRRNAGSDSSNVDPSNSIKQSHECYASADEVAKPDSEQIIQRGTSTSFTGPLEDTPEVPSKTGNSEKNNSLPFRERSKALSIDEKVTKTDVENVSETDTGNTTVVPPESTPELSHKSRNEEASDSLSSGIGIQAQTTTVQSNECGTQGEDITRVAREPCKFSGKCYRKNKTHRETCSHPGDEDFVDNRPECSYGVSCYRKNELHNQFYKHTEVNTRKRRRNRESRVKQGTAGETDESDISLSGSDNYEPSGSEDSEDYSEIEDDDDEDNEEEEEEEEVAVAGKRRKLQRKKKQR